MQVAYGFGFKISKRIRRNIVVMDKHLVILIDDKRKAYAKMLIDAAPAGHVCEIKESTRTLSQNCKLWPMLQDISRQVCWHGYWMTKEEWKDFFTASIKKLRIVPNMDGTGFIAVGCSSSAMGKRMFSDMIELIYAFGAERDVVWSEPGIYKPDRAVNE